MRIGVDLDGTVADLQSALAREANRLFPGIDPASLPASADSGEGSPEAAEEPKLSMPALTLRQQDRLWKEVRARKNFWESLEELEPGALARLSRLTAECRWEIIFLTSRPETAGETAQAQSHRWLSDHGFSMPSVFVVHGSRGRIAASLRLDVVVDDRPENCLDVVSESKARAILIWRGAASTVPASARELDIGAVESINQCLDILESLDRDPSGRVSILDRLKRLLGLKPHTSRVHERHVAGTA
jgi:hypothetical protein